MDKSIYIWGAGHYGALAALDMERNDKVIVGFIDNDKELQGKTRLGYRVFSPKEIIGDNAGKGDKFITIAALAADEIAEELEANGYKYWEDFDIFGTIKRKVNINDLELVENVGILFENEIVLYGLEPTNETYGALKLAGIPVTCFCDNDRNKWGEDVDGIKIISPSELKLLDNDKNLVVIVVTDNVDVMDRIIHDISVLKLKTNKVYTKLGLNVSLLQNVNDIRLSEEHRSVCQFTDSLQPFYLRFMERRNLERVAKRIYDILVYQPAKVGSSTVSASIRKIGLVPGHLHYLNLWNNEIINAYKNILKNQDTIKIITLVREPINRLISLCFHSLFTSSFIGHQAPIISGYSLINTMVGFLKRDTIEQLDCQPEWYDKIYEQFDWFDTELKAVFGVDVYAHPFDREKGYSIIKQGNVEVLAMKMEKLNTLEPVIGEFLRAPQFKLINSNEADKKTYKYLYKSVKDAIKIPVEVFDKYYKNNPKMDHFYSEEEKAAFLKKWGKNIAG